MLKDLLAGIGGLPPLLQIPVIIAAFIAVIALLIFFIEIAPRQGRAYFWIRLAVCLLVPFAALVLLGSVIWAAAIAAVVGGGLFLLDYRSRAGSGYLIQMVGFLAPAILLLLAGLVYPTLQTFVNAFLNARGNRFVGFENFAWIFSQPGNLVVIRNTILWVLVAPVVSTIAGLAYAVFIDKSRGEKYFKILVFMPMAISFVGASIIWRFVYGYRGEGSQYGILNQIVTMFGGEPVNWLQQAPLNTLLLIVVLIWVQTGFAMVVLSAAIKNVPAEQLEAAQIDGTNAWQRFFNVLLPGIRGSMIVVLTTISIASLKVFDIVRTMGTAYPDTGVIANEMVTLLQKFEPGRSSAFAVLLFLLVLPIVVYNARTVKKQRELA